MDETDFTTPHYGIVPATGLYGKDWPSGITPTFPQGIHGELSKGGWSKGNEGFVQQTFLGASISNFNINAGFGQNSTTLNVSLVVDEFNKSDGTFYGSGDDVYHNGREDRFRPPTVGSPVFFKFGKNHANIDQAYRRTYYEIYGREVPKEWELKQDTTTGPINTIPENYFLDENRPIDQSADEVVQWEDQTALKDPESPYRGWNHFVFGGILSSYTKDEGSARTLSAVVSDPREILSNVQLILNDYKGSVGNNKNVINIYGFLEYERSRPLTVAMENNKVNKNLIFRDFYGNFIGALPDPVTGEPVADCYEFDQEILWEAPNFTSSEVQVRNPCNTGNDYKDIHKYFPVTGAGMARRNKQGMPWYRIYQGLKAATTWCGFDFGFAPCEYLLAGFGGIIDFRGRNFVIDLSGLPLKKIPQLYHINSDQIDLLSLIQEVCGAISHDFVISLLPVLNSKRTGKLFEYNRTCMVDERFGDIITGIIRVDTVDKTVQPQYGSVTSYIENLEKNGIEVESKNLGFTTSNVVTDRIINGHQEVSMYSFWNFKDTWGDPDNPLSYDILDVANTNQILPFFGYLDSDKRVASIPKGGQICLSASNLSADGVGEYYITTESELLAAQAGLENWQAYLAYYNDRYCRTTKKSDATQLSQNLIQLKGIGSKLEDSLIKEGITRELRLTGVECYVPRCLWPSETPYMLDYNSPASPCSPPYGYPLYFGRATALGIDTQYYNNVAEFQRESPLFLQTKMQQALNQNIRLGDAAELWRVNTRDYYTALNDGKLTNLEVLSILEKNFEEIFKEEWYVMRDQINNDAAAWEKKWGDRKFKLAKAATAGIQNWLDKINGAGNRGKNGILDQAVRDKEYFGDGGARGLELKKLDNYITTNYQRNYAKLGQLPISAKQGLDNAAKVHSWLKGIADEHLGRKFLIKLPKACNLNYGGPPTVTQNINFRPVTYDTFAGLHGFPAIAIPGRNLPASPSLLNRTYEYLSADYVNNGDSWTNGALRVNWNEISLDWEFNYKPENAGGAINFVDYLTDSLDGSSDIQVPFLQEGREQSYLSFYIPSDWDNDSELPDGGDFTAQYRFDYTSIPREEVNETGYGTYEIKCQLEEKFVMLPKIVKRKVKVYGDGLTFLGNNYALVNHLKNPTNSGLLEFIPGDNTFFSRFAYSNRWGDRPSADKYAGYMGNEVYINDFLRTINGTSALTENIPEDELTALFTGDDRSWKRTKISTRNTPEKFLVDKRFLNTDHVYVIATISGRVKVGEGEDNKHLQQVKTRIGGVPSFVPGMGRITPYVSSVNLTDIAKRIEASQAANRPSIQDLADLSNPETKIYYQEQPPIYPGTAKVSLMSTERCYGPWMSVSSLDASGNPATRYSDIGGKVEYIKDENLSPWNYGTYAELHVAGSFKAQFSNSLLLFSENGSFTFPDAPAGLTIAKPLHHPQGPLVTSVSVSIGDSVKTTVSMDSYSSNFGQLKKQTEDFLLELGKERRIAIDERNKKIRDASSKQIQASFKSAFDGFDYARHRTLFNHSTVQTELSCSAIESEQENSSSDERRINLLTDTYSSGLQSTNFYNSASISDNTGFLEQSAGISKDQNEYSKKRKATGRENLNNFFIPFDHQPDNPNMPNYDFISKYSIDRRTS